jgi:pimeloyl-ACP methyl ester carboxylesterase
MMSTMHAPEPSDAQALAPADAQPASPTLHRLQAGEVELAYWEWHPALKGRGPTLLFVHATGFHGRVWDQVIRRLPGHHVIALEQRGHGRSSAPPHAGWDTFGRDLAAAAEVLGLHQAIGIGHSMGAHAMVQAAAWQTERFARLVLIDPVIQAPERYHLPPLPAHLLPPAANRKNRFASPEAMHERYADRVPYALFDRQAFRDYVDHALRPADDGDGWQLCCDPAFEASVYGSGRFNMGVYCSVRALHIPVLVVRAMAPDPNATAFNPLASPTWAGLHAEFRQGREIHLSQHGHLVPMQDPGLVARLIQDELPR